MKIVYATKNFQTGISIFFHVFLLDGTYVGIFPATEISNLGVYCADITLYNNIDYLIGVIEPNEISWKTCKHIKGDKMNTYIANVIECTPAANTIHWSFFNTIGSGKIISIDKIVLHTVLDAIRTGHQISFYLQRISTSGIGASSFIGKMDSIQDNLPAQIVILKNLTTNPTLISDAIIGGCNLDTEESRSGTGESLPFDSKNTMTPLVLREGEGIALIQDSYASAGEFNSYIYFNVGN